jgi:excisionase family DNA binding protein
MTPPTVDSPDQLISVTAAARRLDVSLRSLYRLIADKQLPPPLKVGGLSKLCTSDLTDYVQRLKSQRRV